MGMDLPPLRLIAPAALARADTETMLSSIARLVAAEEATTKAQLMDSTGLARSTVTSYVDMLLRRSVLEQQGTVSRGTRGRPADRLQISPRAGLVLAIDLGARHVQVAVGELNQRVAARSSHRIDVRDGPSAVLETISRTLDGHLEEVGDGRAVRCIVIGVPARVHGPSGVAIRPNIMPGWDGFPITGFLAQRFGTEAVLENDVNLRAIGEAAALDDDQRPLLVIKVGTGVGAGLVDANGRVFHGYDGSAGDIGHIPVRGAPELPCSCGTIGCIEAVVSVPSIIRRLKADHPDLLVAGDDELDQLLTLLRHSEHRAVSVVRAAAETLGEAVAMLCNTLNPRRIVLGGELTTATDEVLAGVRAIAYQNARPLATRNLVIGHSVLGELSGLAGALVLARESALAPEAMRRLMR